MRKLLLFFLMFSAISTMAQQSFRGRIVDGETGEPLPGVTIKITGSSAGTVTDKEGYFIVDYSQESKIVLQLSYIGYQGREVEFEKGQEPRQIILFPDVKKLEGVVVTATRSRREILEVPLRVNVLNQEQIEAIPALSADDYLRSIPGVTISRGASVFGSSTVSLRGMGHEAGRTLVMIDGVPVNKSDGGSVNWNAIGEENIGRIEVLKGPGSSIHGGNAMGGVINLISSTPAKRLEGFFSQDYGSFNTSNSNLNFSGKQNNFFWNINGRYRQSDGYITTPADEIDEFSIASFLSEYHAGGRAGYFITPDQMIEVAGQFYSGKRGTGSDFTGYGFQNDDLASAQGAYNKYSNLNARVLYRAGFSDNSQLNVSLYGQNENYQNIRESVRDEVISRYDVESLRKDLGLLSSYSHKINENNTLTGGVDVRHGAVDGRDIYITSTDKVFNLGKMNQLGIYLQDEISFGKTPWSILASVRYDYSNFYDGGFVIESPTNETEFLQDFTGDLDEATFSAFSPRLSLQYFKPGVFRIYSAYSRGFRAPVLDDMCRTGRIRGGMKLANPGLLPEYLDNYELGADVFISDKISVAPSLFYSRGTDYHAYIATGDSLMLNNRMRPIRIKDNIGKVEIMGAEFALNYLITENIDLRASYSHIKTDIVEYRVFDPSEDDDLVGKELVYQPRDIFYSALSWRNKVVNIMVAFNYKGAQWMNDVNSEEIEAYSFVDLHLWRHIYKGFSLGIQAHNLFDQDYIDSQSMITPGRVIHAELRYSF